MIAAHADMDVMSASQILNLMEKSGLIRRTTHSRDSRAKAIALTDLGTAKMQVALPLVECADSLFFGSLGEREPEFKALLHALRAFRFPGQGRRPDLKKSLVGKIRQAWGWGTG